MFNIKFELGWGNKTKTRPEKEPEVIDEDAIKSQAVQEFMSSYTASPENIAAPVKGGRSSVSENSNLNFSPSGTVASKFPYFLLQILEQAAIYNRHVSYAVYNIVTLANTELEIYFADNVSDNQARKMKKHIKMKVGQWYEFSDGDNALKNDLFWQVAVFGALSAEMEVRKDLRGIQKVIRVSPTQIRFGYDKDKDLYVPLQIDPLFTAGAYHGHRELNRQTYSYKALNRFNQEPVAIPPVISAIEDLITENDMLANFKTVIKRLGMLGFLSVLVNMPKPDAGETNTEYQSRLVKHLESIYPQIESGFSRGITIGYKDKYDVNLQGNNINAEGADKVFSIVKDLVYAGIKQDPNMMGESRSTTETFGRVILAKMTQQITNYQTTVASFFEKLFLTELILAGYKPGYVECVFKPAMIGDRKREVEVDQININNIEKKYNLGWISQEQAAQEAGYDQPDLPEPRNKTLPLPGNNPEDESTGPANPTPDKAGDETDAQENVRVVLIGAPAIGEQARKLAYKLRSQGPEYNYTVPEGCGHTRALFAAELTDFKDANIQKLLKAYYNDFNSSYKKLVGQVKANLRKSIANSSSPESITDLVLYHLYLAASTGYKQEVNEFTDEHIFKIYDYYRQDKSIFKNVNSNQKATFADVPDAALGLLDYRAIEFLQKYDSVYLGKFVSDQDTKQRITRWIESNYMQENSPIGKSSRAVDQFLADLDDVLNMERWKARRIIETSANKTRNYANVNYIDQAQIPSYEVTEVLDENTCRYCRHMNGMVFDVKKTVKKINEVVSANIDEVQAKSPFVTTVNIDDFVNLSEADLQRQGFDAPSYHPHCRGRVIAKF